jgi:hypothetical protein
VWKKGHVLFDWPLRTWSRRGQLQPLSHLGSSLQLNRTTSKVLLQTIDDLSDEQVLVLERGQFWNRVLGKVLSMNDNVLTADTNDSRGAVNWTIGKPCLSGCRLMGSLWARPKVRKESFGTGESGSIWFH